MIDLRDTYVRVNTREECEKLFMIARKQGFKWSSGKELFVYDTQWFPNTIRFYPNKDVVTDSTTHKGRPASDVIADEMTAKEFIEGMIKYADECNSECFSCTLFSGNAGCKKSLCSVHAWNGNEEKLLEIVRNKLNETPEEKAAKVLQKHFNNGFCKTPEEQEAIKLAIKKLRGE